MSKQTDLDKISGLPTLELASGVIWVVPQETPPAPPPSLPSDETQTGSRSEVKTAHSLIQWGEAKRLYFRKIDRLPSNFNVIPLAEDTSIIPKQVMALIASVGREFPEAEIYLCHPIKPVKPPVKIPWHRILGVLTTIATVVAFAAAAVLVAALIASLGTFLLIVLALAAADPWVVAKINGEMVCVAVYYD